MPAPRDRIRLTVEVAVYIVIAWLAMSVAGWAAEPLGGQLVGVTVAVLTGALFTNWLTLTIYERRPLPDIGLKMARASWENLLLGLGGGIGAAALVLAPAVAVAAAHFVPVAVGPADAGRFAFVTVFLAVGAAGEEILFRGYGFQLLIANVGAWKTVLPVAVIFALMHQDNPDVTWLALANTAGFGVAFGYAFLRSRDLWLPIGLHFGWNFTLPVFGVNVSGLKMNMTGHELVWSAGKLWSGGSYGPEGSVLTSAVMVALFLYLWKAPIRRQTAPLLDPPAESTPCEPVPPLPF
jgi:uncharacterized protein